MSNIGSNNNQNKSPNSAGEAYSISGDGKLFGVETNSHSH